MTGGGGRALPLRLLLWMGLAVALLAALALGVELLTAPAPEAPSTRDLSLEGFRGAALVGLALAAGVPLLPTLPLLLALRRHSARWAAVGLVVAAILGLIVPALALADARDSPGCPEGTWAFYVAPAWFLLLLFTATTGSSRVALGVERQAAARSLAVAVRVGLTALAVLEAVALVVAGHPARGPVDGLVPGVTRAEVLRRLAPHCSVSGHPGRMLAVCRAVVPPCLRCAPAPAQRVTLELDGQERLVRWQRRWTVAGAGAVGQR